MTITGSATDSGGGVVAGVEVSTDGGATWHPATLTTPAEQTVKWSYTWVAHGNPTTTIRSRAVDDSANLEKPSAGITVNVSCPCSIWGSDVTPTTPDSGDGSSVEVGLKFTSEVFGTVTGVRFYKAAANTGTHIGSLWSSTGTLLATATFTNETASGWQQVNFSTPVQISAEHHLRRRLSRTQRPLLGGLLLLLLALARPGRKSLNSPPLHAVPPAAREQRALLLHDDLQLPDEHLQRHELLGRPGLLAGGTSRPGDRRQRDRRGGLGAHILVCADKRRCCHQLHGHALHRDHRTDGHDDQRLAAGDQHPHHRSHARHRPTPSRCRRPTPTAPGLCRQPPTR